MRIQRGAIIAQSKVDLSSERKDEMQVRIDCSLF